MKKFTLLTGACGGLGNSFLELCLKNQEKLILVGTSAEKLNHLTKKYEKELGSVEFFTFVCDLSKSEDIKNLIQSIKDNNISVTKLINNAGVIIEGDIEKTTDDKITNAIEVNCVGTLNLTKNIIEIRDKSQKLEILTVASQAAFQPIPHMAVYAATKSFLVSMMTALSFEFKDKNVVFITVCPSGMPTTKAMQDSIKSMGISGKLTTLSTKRVAKIAFKALRKKKKIVIPGTINKVIYAFSKLFSPAFLARVTGNLWRKSQQKRGL